MAGRTASGLVKALRDRMLKSLPTPSQGSNGVCSSEVELIVVDNEGGTASGRNTEQGKSPAFGSGGTTDSNAPLDTGPF